MENIIIFNINTILLVLILLFLIYITIVLFNKSRFKFKGNVSKSNFIEYFKNIESHFIYTYSKIKDGHKKYYQQSIKSNEDFFKNIRTDFTNTNEEIIKEHKKNYRTLMEYTKNSLSDLKNSLSDLNEKIEKNKTNLSIETSKLKLLINEIDEKFKKELINATKAINEVKNQLDDSLKDVNNIAQYMIKNINEKDARLEKYEQDYNIKITKKLFGNGIFEILDFIKSELKNKDKNKDNKILLDLEDDLLLLLENNSIKRLELKEGDTFNRKEFQIGTKTFPVYTDNKFNDNKISHINTHGYYTYNETRDNKREIIRPAQIGVYHFKTKEYKDE